MYIVRFILILMLILAGCAPRRTATVSFFEVTGNQATRVERVTAMLAQVAPLPTPLHDAHFVEEQIGDNELGPADYRAFLHLEIASADVALWLAGMTPLDHQPAYAAPLRPPAWWLDEARFATLHFYAPNTLTSRANGWVAVDAPRGQIYIYTFTT